MENNGLRIFNNEQFCQVRIVTIDGEPWFVGKDVCAAFGDTNYRRSLGRLDADEKGVSQIETRGGKQSVTVVNEAGLYSLLFAMEPQKAKGVSQNDTAVEERIQKLNEFKRWVTHDVIPSIRKHGGYLTETAVKRILDEHDSIFALAQAILEEKLKYSVN